MPARNSERGRTEGEEVIRVYWYEEVEIVFRTFREGKLYVKLETETVRRRRFERRGRRFERRRFERRGQTTMDFKN